jgi:hypothetical protein
MTTIDIEKCMIATIWPISGIPSLLVLTKGMKYNSQCSGQDVIPVIQQNICLSGRRRTLKDILLRLDNARSRNLRLFSEKIESAKAQRAPLSPYDSDSGPSDFFPFRYLKEKHRDTSSSMSDDRIFALQSDVSEIPEIVLKNVFTNWITRLTWTIEKRSEDCTR